MTLCEECHNIEREVRPDNEHDLLHFLREKFFSEEIHELAGGFHMMELCHAPEVVASVYKWALSDENIQRELIDRYFKHIKEVLKKK